jgi:aspartate aminotransferase
MSGISSELSRLLEPQLRLDRLRDVAVRHGGRGFVDLAYANSYAGPAEESRAAIRRALDAPSALALQYTPYGGATVPRRLAAETLSKSHQLPFQLKDVVLTPGAMAALNVLFRSVKGEEPGAEVIVITPCWLDYPTYLENLGLKARLVPVDESTLRLDLDAIARALSPQTKAIVFSQPANPSGLIYSADELQRLARLLDTINPKPLLISDECHRDFVFSSNRFVSPLAFYDSACVVYSFGKALALQGQRLGYVAVSPRHPERHQFAQELQQWTRIMGFCTPTALMQLALGDLLNIPAPVGVVATQRERAVSALQRAGYELIPSEATFFLYPRAPGGDAWAFTEQLAQRGVMVLPSEVFHHSGHFRISLTASDEMLDRGLAVMHALSNAAQ